MAIRDNRFTRDYSDAEYVEGLMRRDPVIGRALDTQLKKYFDMNCKSVFFVDLTLDDKKDIFQESFLAFWENIEAGKLYVENGQLFGKGGNPFKSKLTTYFMSIAKFKYYEWVRKNSQKANVDMEDAGLKELLLEMYLEEEPDESEIKLAIISDCLSHMQEHCRQILTLFYYELKTLDEILKQLHYINKDSLKNAKCRCVNSLQDCSNSIYQRFYN